MATPEQLNESRKKALLSPDIGKRGKGKATIVREQRRIIFDEIVSEEFPELIKQAKPEYKLDQFLGKAKDTVDINLKGNINVTDPKLKELAEKYEEELKAKINVPPRTD